MSRKRNVLRAALVAGVLLAGAAVALILYVTRPQPAQRPREDRGALVEVEEVRRGDEPLRLELQGELRPAQRIVLQPQIAGRVAWVSPELVPGGRVEEGQALVRIEDRDYRLALDQARAEVQRAAVQLREERSRREIARREWEMLADEVEGEPSALAMREPQLAAARQALEAARSNLEQQRINLERTEIEAPFDAVVQEEAVDVGQLVGQQSTIASLVGMHRFWAMVSVPVERLAWVKIPGANAEAGEGSPALVMQQAGDGTIARTGRVARLLGELDPNGRMARLLVAVDDPLGLEEETREIPENTSGLPLLLNAYADVIVDAGELPGVIRVPRQALREGDTVYVMNEAGRLEMREVEIAWRAEDSVLVRTGLRSGDRVVMSRLPAAVEGMKLRASEDAPAAGEANGAGGAAP